MRLAAARAASGSSPAATAACPHASLLPVIIAFPSGEVTKAISSGLGSFGCKIWSAIGLTVELQRRHGALYRA